MTCAWLRRLDDVGADPNLSEEDTELIVGESTAYLYGLADMLNDVFCVNPIVAAMATTGGRGKLSQLEFARRVGMTIPRTLATNDPDAASEFLASCDGGAIYKGILPPVRLVGEEGGPQRWAGLFTTKLDEQSKENLGSVRLGPCLFQELIPKRFDLRVTVMGNKVFATEIHSQVHEASSIDFRARYALGSTPYAPHELPDSLKAQILALNRSLGIIFGAYDFVLTPEGQYVFLEVNQQGQFLWLEEMTGQPLLENFCELLIQQRLDFVCDAPMHAPGPLPTPLPTDEYDVE